MDATQEQRRPVADTGQEALRGPASPLVPYEETSEYPLGRQRALLGPPMGILSPEVRPESGIHGPHGFNCALPCRGGQCDCDARKLDLRTSGRGFTYSLAQMLKEKP